MVDPSLSHCPWERRKKRSKKTTPKRTSKEKPTLDSGYPPELEQSDSTCTNFSLQSFNYPSVQAPGTMSPTTGFPLSANSNYQAGPSIQPSALPNWQINTAAIPNNVAAMLSQQFGRVYSLSYPGFQRIFFSDRYFTAKPR